MGSKNLLVKFQGPVQIVLKLQNTCTVLGLWLCALAGELAAENAEALPPALADVFAGLT